MPTNRPLSVHCLRSRSVSDRSLTWLAFGSSCLIATAAFAQPEQRGPAREQAASTQPANAASAEHEITIEEIDGYRVFKSNGIPDHTPGAFPNRGNPNTISAQSYEYRVTLTPEANEQAQPARGIFGVALNGVPFDPGTAEFWEVGASLRDRPGRDRSSGWNFDALSGNINLGVDDHHAHVQPTGAYHYHGLPTGLIDLRRAALEDHTHEDGTFHAHDADAAPTQMVLVGYAADGFPMYASWGHEDPSDASSPLVKLTPSMRLIAGERPDGDATPPGPGGAYDGTFVQDWEYVQGAGDLDECNGRFGVTPEYPDGIYHYYLTDTYPFVPRLWRGTPDQSFARRGGGGERGERGERGQRRERGPRNGQGGGGFGGPPPRR